MSVPIPTGVFDILPKPHGDEWRSSAVWHYVETTARRLAELYAFQEISTPIIERTELFARTVGDESDIVSKEMYTFEDRGGRRLSLRPEGTAGVVRALVSEGAFQQNTNLRLFYIGPMFRYERPQAGRFRQHHQFGVEVFGASGPQQDAELIEMLVHFYRMLGIPDLKVYINSLGTGDARHRFVDALKEYLYPKKDLLSPESRIRFDKNPLRILDSKSAEDIAIIENAPSILEFLDTADRDHFEKVQSILKHLNVAYEVNHLLVRGLDYYQRTVFEVTSGKLGAQNTVGAGGRYDGLVKQLGGPDIGSIGFATGLERVIQTLLKTKSFSEIPKQPLHVSLIPMGEEQVAYAMAIAARLREIGLSCLVDFSFRKLKNALSRAVEMAAQYVIVIGENELITNRLEVKKLATAEKKTIALEALTTFLQHAVNVADESI